MQTISISGGEVGKVCPYCRDTFKDGMQAVRCGVCGTLHHPECWTEGLGCSTLGCANAKTLVAPAWPSSAQQIPPPPPLGKSGASQAPPPPPPPPPGGAWGPPSPGPGSSGSRGVLIGIAAALVLVLLGGGGYLVLHKSAASVTTIITTDPHQHHGPSGPSGNSGPTGQQGYPADARVARQLDAIVQRSRLGRVKALRHDYQGAIQNRELTLERLASLSRNGISPGLRASINTFTKAIQWSLLADRQYDAGNNNPQLENHHATALKETFVNEFDPIAVGFGLPTFSAGDI